MEFSVKRSIAKLDLLELGRTTKERQISMKDLVQHRFDAIQQEIGKLVVSELIAIGGEGIVRITAWSQDRLDLPAIKEIGILATVEEVK